MVQLIVDITPKDLFDYATAFGPIIAALIACGLAWWQGKIQEKQHNLALFKERWSVKKQLEKNLSEIKQVNSYNDNYLDVAHNLMEIIDISQYLYNEEICNTIKKLQGDYILLNNQHKKIDSLKKFDKDISENEYQLLYRYIDDLFDHLKTLLTEITAFMKRNNF